MLGSGIVSETPNFDEIDKVALADQERLAESFLPTLFAVINYTHFENKLLNCRVKWSDRIGTGKHGHRVSDFTVFDDAQFPPVIRLSKSLLSGEVPEKITQALFFAMVHIWLWSHKKPWGHTKEFYEISKKFDFDLIKEKTDF